MWYRWSRNAMTITKVIEQLQDLRVKFGDIEVVTDCECCGASTVPTVIVVGPPVIRLKTVKEP